MQLAARSSQLFGASSVSRAQSVCRHGVISAELHHHLSPRVGGRLTSRSARAVERVTAAAGKGGVLDSPTLSPTFEKNTLGDRKKPPMYKVMLHNDNYNRREYVVTVLIKVVEGLTVDDAVVVMQEAHETGVALVVACAQDVAETYVESLRLNGLVSTLEPGH